MSQVIGRVVTGTYETVRGPDVLHRISVKREWLLRGELVELELPRNLTCAACDGGGCDRCERSGAIALRRRGDPAEVVQVTLPKRTAEEISEQPTLVLRVPGHGGRDSAESVEARGILLLRVVAAAKGDPRVRRVRGGPSTKPAPKVPRPIPAGSARAPLTAPQIVAIVVTLGWIALVFALGASVPR